MAAQAALKKEAKAPDRFSRIREILLSEPVYLCPERALLITEYFKHHDNKKEPMVIRKAKAFRYLLKNKSVKVFPDELIVGNMGARRKSAVIQPELAGVFMCEELLWIDRRKTTPHPISWADRSRLLTRVIPYWLPRNMAVKAFRKNLTQFARYIPEQLKATYYLINEAGGIGHFLPNYEKMIQLGIDGYLALMKGRKSNLAKAAAIACEGLADFTRRLGNEATRQADSEKDSARSRELRKIADICRKVPQNPAETFHEALQSLWLTHMGVCLEGLNSAVSFGRVDQFCIPITKKILPKDGSRRRKPLNCSFVFRRKPPSTYSCCPSEPASTMADIWWPRLPLSAAWTKTAGTRSMI